MRAQYRLSTTMDNKRLVKQFFFIATPIIELVDMTRSNMAII